MAEDKDIVRECVKPELEVFFEHENVLIVKNKLSGKLYRLDAEANALTQLEIKGN